MPRSSVHDELPEGTEGVPVRSTDGSNTAGRSMIDGNLLVQYVPNVYGFARRLTRDDHAAEDLTQETLLHAIERIDTLRDVGRTRIWLFRIAANLWRDQWRRSKHPAARPAVGYLAHPLLSAGLRGAAGLKVVAA